jgi:hypothetical protein
MHHPPLYPLPSREGKIRGVPSPVGGEGLGEGELEQTTKEILKGEAK